MRRLLARLLIGRPRLRARLNVSHSRPGRCAAGSIEVPAERWPEIVRAVAAAVVEVATGWPTLGQVTVVAGEEPVLLAVRSRPDLIAGRVVAALTSGAAHRRPTLWLALPAGRFLGDLVDPDRPFSASPVEITALVGEGRCALALLTDVEAVPTAITLRFELYGAPSRLRGALRSARRCLAALPGWESPR